MGRTRTTGGDLRHQPVLPTESARGVDSMLGPLGWAGIASIALFGCILGLLVATYFDMREANSATYRQQQLARVEGLAKEAGRVLPGLEEQSLSGSADERRAQTAERYPVAELAATLPADETWVLGPDRLLTAIAATGEYAPLPLDPQAADPRLLEMITLMRAGVPGSTTFTWIDPTTSDPEQRVASFAPIPDAPEGWALAISSPESVALAGTSNALWNLLVAISGMFAAFFGFGGIALALHASAQRQRTALAREREAMQCAAAHSERLAMVGTMTAGVAHDMRGPLASLGIMIELIRQGDLTVEPDLLEDMDICIAQLRELATDLTGFSRDGTGTEAADADPARAIRTALRLVGPDCARYCEVDLGDRPLPIVSIAEQRLIQVLLNLLINAEQVAERIHLHAWTSPTGVEIVVEDDGPGIPPEIGDTLFDAFVTRREDGGGTGLGLFLCKRFITDAGGDIRVDRGSMGGARFHFHLPVLTTPEVEVRPMAGVRGATISTGAAAIRRGVESPKGMLVG